MNWKGWTSMVMEILDSPGLDRLGIGRLFRDHHATLYRLDAHQNRVPRRADWIVLWGIPLVVGALAAPFGWGIASTAPILNGVAIIAGGLFGLLVLILGVQTLGQTAGRPPAVRDLIRETRANASYATAWALSLAVALMIVEAFREESAHALAGWATGLVLAAVLHLGLVLLLVLNRIRLVFTNLG